MKGSSQIFTFAGFLAFIGALIYGFTQTASAQSAGVSNVETPGQPSVQQSGSGKLSAAEIGQYAASAGFSGDDLVTAVAIALAESGGNPNAIGDTSLAPRKGPSVGLFQIDIGSSEHPEFSEADMRDPQKNCNAAYTIYQQAGYSFSPWSTFNSGAYSAFMDSANGAIQNG